MNNKNVGISIPKLNSLSCNTYCSPNSCDCLPTQSGTGSITLYNSSNKKLYYNNNLQVVDSSTIIVNSNIYPNESNIFSLGSLDNRWKEIFIGPGSLNVQGPTGSIYDGIISSSINGIIYSKYGFATRSKKPYKLL